MKNKRIDVIATTISGSIQDWGKVKHIVPLFKSYGFNNVTLYSVDTHAAVMQEVQGLLTVHWRDAVIQGST